MLGFKKTPDYDEEMGSLFELGLCEFFMKEGLLIPKPYYFGAAFSENLKIQYVHQVQNICFALTGEELTLAPASVE
jgi:hypothetical protein